MEERKSGAESGNVSVSAVFKKSSWFNVEISPVFENEWILLNLYSSFLIIFFKN